MMAVDTLKKKMPVARVSRAMGIPRSSIYYSKMEKSSRKSRVSGSIETEIKRISRENNLWLQKSLGTPEEFRHLCEHKDCEAHHDLNSDEVYLLR